MQTPCQGCPGQDVYLTTQVPISRSQLQQWKGCKRLPLKVLQVPSRHTVVICTFWMQSRTVFKAKQPKAPLKNIIATHPLELVHLNYLCLEPGKGLEENVLVVIDHFIRYVQAYVTRTQTAQTTAKTLWNKFIVHYGLPKKILLDQG